MKDAWINASVVVWLIVGMSAWDAADAKHGAWVAFTIMLPIAVVCTGVASILHAIEKGRKTP